MRRILFLTISALAASGCGTTTDNNRPTPIADRPAMNAAANTNVVANTAPAPLPATGTKVTAASDHKFSTEGIPKGWKWIDPDTTNGAVKFDTSGVTLKFTVPTGKDMFGDNPLYHGRLDRLIGYLLIVDDNVYQHVFGTEASAADFNIAALFVDLRFYAVELDKLLENAQNICASGGLS